MPDTVLERNDEVVAIELSASKQIMRNQDDIKSVVTKI